MMVASAYKASVPASQQLGLSTPKHKCFVSSRRSRPRHRHRHRHRHHR
ncbi:hypothetical protein STTU_0963 [Streptomyces sp. Tu6071]|nr:hypothetical protein STTU_0963 [Streptomyces sp. Tu6071]